MTYKEFVFESDEWEDIKWMLEDLDEDIDFQVRFTPSHKEQSNDEH
jgi:hypothetical protein